MLIARFLKTDDSGEIFALKRIPEIKVIACDKTFGFYYQMSEHQKSEAKKYYGMLLERSFSEAEDHQAYDILVLDEIMAACSYGMVEEAVLVQKIKSRPTKLELVMTGRNPSPALKQLADYISDIQQIRHPFEQGISARAGIEY